MTPPSLVCDSNEGSLCPAPSGRFFARGAINKAAPVVAIAARTEHALTNVAPPALSATTQPQPTELGRYLAPTKRLRLLSNSGVERRQAARHQAKEALAKPTRPPVRGTLAGWFLGGGCCAVQSCLRQRLREDSECVSYELQHLPTRRRTKGACGGFMREFEFAMACTRLCLDCWRL